MPRTFESPDANVETGRQLRQFFTDLLDDTNLREYHANTEAYVASQVKAGVINDATANLILQGSLQDIEDNIKMVTGSGSAVPVCIVMPPM
jgi:argininosuccinate lyase